MSDAYDLMGTRRRSNTAQRLEKLRKERKTQSKTKVITWRSPTKLVEVEKPKGDDSTNHAGNDAVDINTYNFDGNLSSATILKRLVLNPSALNPEELALLEYDPKANIYCK